MADKYSSRCAWPIILLDEKPAELWYNAEQLKETPVHPRPCTRTGWLAPVILNDVRRDHAIPLNVS
jgi:hypothetical protein